MDTHAEPRIFDNSDPALRAMFEARKRVFVDLLQWDVPVLADRYEVDQFDTSDAAYLVLADGTDTHRASARLLRTDRPHILADLFPFLCSERLPQGDHVREITRFCIEPTLARLERRAARDELVTALAEHALQTGLSGYTAVANIAWYRQISRFGWKCRSLGPTRDVAGETLIALHIEIDADTRADLSRGGIYRASSYRFAHATEELMQ